MIEDEYESINGTRIPVVFYAIEDHEADARKLFETDMFAMIEFFERVLGPYPWGHEKLGVAETPHLGMEHQSAVAYGNGFQNGYRGRDLSNTGWGLLWDFIIIHEAGHEWFGNNITTADVAASPTADELLPDCIPRRHPAMATRIPNMALLNTPTPKWVKLRDALVWL